MTTGDKSTHEQKVLVLLRSRLPDARIARCSKGTGADFRIERTDGRAALVEVKRLSTVRHDDLLGRFAMGVMQLRHARTEGRDDLVVIVTVPRATSRSVAAVEEFMTRHAPEVGWGLVDDAGSVLLEIPAWHISLRERAARGDVTRSLRSSPTSEMFTDLHSWMLKLLLLRGVDTSLWGGPRDRIASVADLERVGSVSRMTAHRFIETFESTDFLRFAPEGLSIVLRGELVQRWLAHAQQVRVPALHVRWAYGEAKGLEDVFTEKSDVRFAVGGFAACRLLGVQHASAGMSEIYVDGYMGRALEAWDLTPCDERDAQFVLLRTPLGESVFRGRVRVGPLDVVDVLQAALDVSRHAARGHEQCEYILHEVLGWRDV